LIGLKASSIFPGEEKPRNKILSVQPKLFLSLIAHFDLLSGVSVFGANPSGFIILSSTFTPNPSGFTILSSGF
jgi:hypothetical protein